MGIILGKFRKKNSTNELLEKLDNDIKCIEEYRLNTEQAHKKVGQIILTTVGLYIIITILVYFYSFPSTLKQHLYYAFTFTIIPFVIYLVKCMLTWWYNRKIIENHSKLISLRAEKKKILEKVMETETYKVARDILDKFAPDQFQHKTNVFRAEPTPSKQLVTPRPNKAINTVSGSQIRQRNLPLTPNNSSRMLTQTPSASSAGQLVATLNGQGTGTPAPTLPLPRTILSRDRSFMEKMVEYIVGDGPSNRFALICKQCNSHNGMALKEEFEYIAFRCCYCYNMNPARKQRPTAPKLDFDNTVSFKNPFISEFSDSEQRSIASKSVFKNTIPSTNPFSSESSDSAASDSDSETDVAPVISEDVDVDEEENTNENSGNGEGDSNVTDLEVQSSPSNESDKTSDIEDSSSVKTEQNL